MINSLINSITNNEDLRQELWLHYLDGHDVESFADHFLKLQIEYSDDLSVRQNVWHLIQNPSNELDEILNHFSDFEKSIMFLITVGYSVEEVSELKGISEVRIRQTLSSIRYNSVWEEKYGIKEESI